MSDPVNVLDSLAAVVGVPNSFGEVCLAIRNDGLEGTVIVGSGTVDDPWDVSTAEKFDYVMNNPAFARKDYLVIHLGPGLFRTKGGGGNGVDPAWSVRKGQRFIGSGINSTRVMLASQPWKIPPTPLQTKGGVSVFLGGQDVSIEDVEISDMTIDCNMAGQPVRPSGPGEPPALYPMLAASAISLAGRNLRVRRVRVVNFGTRTPLVVNGDSDGTTSLECFPIRLGGRSTNTNDLLDLPSRNCVVEDCVIEKPYPANARLPIRAVLPLKAPKERGIPAHGNAMGKTHEHHPSPARAAHLPSAPIRCGVMGLRVGGDLWTLCDPFRDRGGGGANRGCRSAQPPAIGCHPCGMGERAAGGGGTFSGAKSIGMGWRRAAWLTTD